MIEITYKFKKNDKIPVCFLFEPKFARVQVTNYENYVFVKHENSDKISISVDKHIAQPIERATISWSNWNTKGGGDVEFADMYSNCLDVAITIASLINAHYKKGN